MMIFEMVLGLFLFITASNALAIHHHDSNDNNDDSQTRLEIKESFATMLQSLRNETVNLKMVAQNDYASIENKLNEFEERLSNEIWDDLNQKRIVLHQLRKNEAGNPNCMELITHLGHSAVETVSNINKCVMERSEKGEKYFKQIDSRTSARLERLNDLIKTAGQCNSIDNIESFDSCLRNLVQPIVESQQRVLFSSINQLNTLRQTLDSYLISCTKNKHDAYRLMSSEFIEAGCSSKKDSYSGKNDDVFKYLRRA